MKKNSTFVTVVVIVIAIGMILTYSSIFTMEGKQNKTQPQQAETINQTDSYSYQGEDGKTALELLKEKYSVETKKTDLGEMVIGINGRKADQSKEFWAFMVNGKMAMEGADSYQTKANDIISWKLTKITQS